MVLAEIDLILNAICNVLLYPVDDTLFSQFIDLFCKVADKHPIFTSAEKQDIQQKLRGIAIRSLTILDRTYSLYSILNNGEGCGHAVQENSRWLLVFSGVNHLM